MEESKGAQTVINGLMCGTWNCPVLAVKRRRPHKAQSIADRWEPFGVRLLLVTGAIIPTSMPTKVRCINPHPLPQKGYMQVTFSYCNLHTGRDSSDLLYF